MSIQKGLKKGFTLIELMVVIVIIGILAAVAIPKLFGMSAKAKAQEVGPAAGTWVKLQQAYKMETNHWGNPKEISYKIPGADQEQAENMGKTSNFQYTLDPADATVDDDGKHIDGSGTTGTFTAKNKFVADECAEDNEWKADLANDKDDATMTPPTDAGCKILTPNFTKIGVTATAPAGGGT